MVRFAAVVALCVTTTCIVRGAPTSNEAHGFQMATNAYEAVCWWENLKQFPNTNTKGFLQCTGQAEAQKDRAMTDVFFDKWPQKRTESFGKWITSMAMVGLPAVYQNKCTGLLSKSNSNAAPAADESDALNDGGSDYPYKAFAYCLLHTLREEHGDGAIQAVKDEKTHSKKDWMQALLDRENEFRARHGVEPLQMSDELGDAAKKWAETNAAACKMYHSENEDPDRQYGGGGTGESLAGVMGDNRENAAYQAADGWYEEIKDYPFPDGFQGNTRDPFFKKIGHFTQSVWKDSKQVGYGYSYNPNCPKDNATTFVVARYFPAGNMNGAFPINVQPTKDS